MLEQLREDHVELLALSGKLRVVLGAPALQEPGALARLRQRLTMIVRRHLNLEDVWLYAPLKADPRPEAQALSARFKDELGQLYRNFEAHLLRWTAEAVMRDWDGYRYAALRLLDALEARIRCEEDELYPLIADDVRRSPLSAIPSSAMD